jgi:hypothetical protein
MEKRQIALAVGAAFVVVLLLGWFLAVMISILRRRVDLCPACNSNRIRPSWPRFSDAFLSLSSIAAFRCEACLTRFYGRRT